MSDPSILFCTPCYGSMVHALHFKSCLELRAELISAGLYHDWLIGTNESLITRARNEMTATFLKSEHSHMFWLDADIEFTAEDVSKVWNMEADIGVGVYAMKKIDKQQFAAWKDGALVTNLDQFDGPIEVDYAGTGFMCIKREVIEALTDKHGTYKGQWGPVPCLYQTPFTSHALVAKDEGGVFMESEDYFFCRIAREAGFKVMMDPSARLGHWGQYRFGA